MRVCTALVAALLCLTACASAQDGATATPEAEKPASCPACQVADCASVEAKAAKSLEAAQADTKKASAERTEAQDALQQAEASNKKTKEELATALAEVKQLKSEKEAAQASSKLAESQGQEFSLLALAGKVQGLTGALATHALSKTEVDDQILDAASRHLGTAKKAATTAVDTLSAANYAELLSTVTKHELYVTKVAPALEKASKAAEPHLKQYVYPALDQVKVQADQVKVQAEPHVKKVTELAEPHVKKVTELFTGLVAPASKVANLADLADQASLLLTRLDLQLATLLEPAFVFVQAAAPAHAGLLPKGGLDLALSFLVALVALYYGLRLAFFALRKSVVVARITLRITLRIAIGLPLKVVRKLVSYAIFFATCFHCCGLCGRKRGASANAKNQPAASGGKGKKAQKATLEDTVTLVDTVKQKGNLGEKSVKLLLERADKGQVMEGKNYPACVQGKQLDKDVLKKALNKFKEVDMKKLGL